MFIELTKTRTGMRQIEFFLEYDVVFYNLEYAVNWVAY